MFRFNFRIIFRFRESEGTLGEYLGLKKQQNHEELEIDLEARKVRLGDKEIVLRKKEFDLLAYLFLNKGKVCQKDEIAKEVWKQEGGIVTQETIEQNIRATTQAFHR